MRNGTRVRMLFIVVMLTMTTCSATVKQPAAQVTLDYNSYLPLVTKYNPWLNTFGVDGIASLDHMRTAGVSWLRLNTQLHWSEIETTPGVYDWSKAAQIESSLIDAAKNGLNVILLVQNAPSWAKKYPNSICGPIREDKIASFGNFMDQVVRRYSRPPYSVKYFQIWNEPDDTVNETMNVNGCWAEDTDETFGGKYYGKMLAQVYPRIKAANPDAQVVMGSLMLLCDPRDTNPENYCATTASRKSATFFSGVVEVARDAFDMVMFNAGPSFSMGQNPVWAELNHWRWESTQGGMVNGKISYLRDVMAAYGINKPIIHSEAYLLDRPSDSVGANIYEEYKADYLVWVYANGWAQNLKAVVWYSVEGWKGSELIKNGTEKTKAYNALSVMIRNTQNAQSVSRVDYSAGYARFTFTSTVDDVWLLVPKDAPYGKSYNIAKPATFKRAVDIYGRELTITSSTITFTRPIYIFVSE